VTRSILIVDDEPKARDLLDALLVNDDYLILHAPTGERALALATQFRPDVVLLDVMMPHMDGYEVCRRLRQDPRVRHVPIIMLTALDDADSRLKGFQAGADDYLSKPYDALELRTRLRSITRLNRFRLLSEERARFEAVVQAAPDGIVLADRRGNVVLTNPAFDRLVPVATGPRNIFDLLDLSAAPGWRAQVEACESGHPLPPLDDARLRQAGRPEAVVEVAGCAQAWEGETFLHLHVRDVTRARQLEAQLLRAQRIDLLGQVASGIVHDVNNVLMAVGGYAELIGAAPAGPASPRHLEAIASSVARGGALLRKILAFAHGSREQMREVSVRVELDEVKAIASGTLGRKYSLRLDVPDGLPSLVTDPTALHQVLLNLCVNARDAMPDGGEIELSARRLVLDEGQAAARDPEARAGDYLVLAVKDTGTGMTEEVRAHLFDPFFTTKAAGSGTGLGLATVLRLVRDHGGFVSVETAPGKGSGFSCHFPIDTAYIAPTRTGTP
jgi:two-component system, cell cycle sensor histidine kinase and response regulator CckA